MNMTKEEFFEKYLELKLFPESDRVALDNIKKEFDAGLLRVTKNDENFILLYKVPFTMNLFNKLLVNVEKNDKSIFEKSDKSIFEIMAMYKTEVENDSVMSVIKPGDVVLFTDTTYGLVINDNEDNIIISCNGSYKSDDDIIEVRRPDKLTVSINDDDFQNYELVWPVKKTCFLGISYQASEEYVSLVDYLKDQGYNIIIWDDCATTLANNVEVQQAQRHVIIPPSSFKYNRLIGLGLYNQIQTRAASGKSTEIYDEFNSTISPIKQVIKINDSTPKQYAIVVI